jgi:hypothetical protein
MCRGKSEVQAVSLGGPSVEQVAGLQRQHSGELARTIGLGFAFAALPARHGHRGHADRIGDLSERQPAALRAVLNRTRSNPDAR